MFHFPSTPLEQVVYGVAAAILLVLGYQIGRWFGTLSSAKLVSQKEQDLFTAQRGFKQLYEQELVTLKTDNARLIEENKALGERVEEYRKKAAGYGGLFNAGGKRADAMY